LFGKGATRQSIINEFHLLPSFGVRILSTAAVAFDVNVQAENHVIYFTRPWNPAKEDQATDRTYPIGQDKEVFVY
jgi:SNF2 family DNA or RNA helicase